MKFDGLQLQDQNVLVENKKTEKNDCNRKIAMKMTEHINIMREREWIARFRWSLSIPLAPISVKLSTSMSIYQQICPQEDKLFNFHYFRTFRLVSILILHCLFQRLWHCTEHRSLTGLLQGSRLVLLKTACSSWHPCAIALPVVTVCTSRGNKPCPAGVLRSDSSRIQSSVLSVQLCCLLPQCCCFSPL